MAATFRASDYLLAGLCSPEGAPPRDAVKYADGVGAWPAELPRKQQLFSLRVVCREASGTQGEQADSPGARSVSSASTASVANEAHSPSRRRRAGTHGGGDGSSSDDESDCSSSNGQQQQAQDHGPAGRYSNVPQSPSSAGPAAADSPAALPAGDSFATPPAGLLPYNSSTSGGSCSAGSRAATLASARQGASPQQHIEVLEARLGAELGARQQLQRRMAEERTEAERQRQALGQQYEQQLVALRAELQRGAAAGGQGVGASMLLTGSQQLTLSLQEQQALAQQLAEQELLVKALNAENELAVGRMKQQAADQQRQAAEAAQQVEELQQALAQAQAERARQLPGTPAVDAARLTEMLRLQGEVESVRAAAWQRERELQQQVEHLQRQLQEVQQRQGEPAASDAALQQSHVQLTESDALVQQQARVIAQLEQQLLYQDAHASSNGNSASTWQQQQQQQLEAENASLRQALAEAHASGAPVGAEPWAGGGGDLSSQQLEELQGKLTRLQDALSLKEAQHQRQLRALQREHERLRVDQGIRAAGKAGAARVRELEGQLQQEREATSRKLRLLEARLNEAEASSTRAKAALPPRAAGSTPAASSLGGRTLAPARATGKAAAAQQEALLAATCQLQQKEQRVRRLESDLAKRDAELASLQRQVAVADEQANAAAEREIAIQDEVAALRQAVAEVAAANDGLQVQARQALEKEQAGQRQLAAQQHQLDEWRQQGERLKGAEQALAELQRAQEEKIAAAASERLRSQRELAALEEQALAAGRQAAATEWRPQVEAAEAAAAEWRTRVGRLEADLRSARAGLPWVPSAADFSALERRVGEVEAAAQRREAHWRGVAEDRACAAAGEQRRLRTAFEGDLAAKQQQVDDFRRQLDGLLAAARSLHAAGGVCG